MLKDLKPNNAIPPLLIFRNKDSIGTSLLNEDFAVEDEKKKDLAWSSGIENIVLTSSCELQHVGTTFFPLSSFAIVFMAQGVLPVATKLKNL